MSALAQQHNIFSYSQRHLSEVELLRTISNITWNADHEEEALASIATAILRVPSLSAFRFEPFAGIPHLPIVETSRPRETRLSASAISNAAANGHSFGQVRIFFEAHSQNPAESPVRLAKFLGQQLGLLLHRLAMSRERQRHVANLDALARTTRRRKIIHRAAVVLAEQRSVSESQAISLMVNYARHNRQNLLNIAESLIFGYDSTAFTRPSLRRLTPTESTSQCLR
jgi:ANTAR domain-containing protein